MSRPLLVHLDPDNDWMLAGRHPDTETTTALCLRAPTDAEILAQPCVVEALKKAREDALREVEQRLENVSAVNIEEANAAEEARDADTVRDLDNTGAGIARCLRTVRRLAATTAPK